MVTFSQPVETPGVHIKGWAVLPAGTYVFKLLGSPSDRHIVQIFNQDETMLYATVLAIPNYRLQATGKTVLTFRETPPGQPDVLRAWFYPGKNFGDEFVYPKQRALELAKVTNSPVLYTPAEIPAEVTAPITSPEEPVVVQLKQAPVAAVQPTGEDVEIAQVVTPAPAEAQVAETPAPSSGAPENGESDAADRAVGIARLRRSLQSQISPRTRSVNDHRACFPGSFQLQTGRGVLGDSDQ